jgi:omega-amidase
MPLTIALGQFDVLVAQPDANFRTVRRMTAEAARNGANLIVFPELWHSGYDLAHAADYATPTDQGVFAAVADLARENRIGILGSCLAKLGPARIGNTAVLFGPNGKSLAEYTKIHLFRPMEEDRYLTSGDRGVVVDTPWGRAGLAICYDLRFPELFRAYAVAGAEMIFVVAQWPLPRQMHWETLLRARAIENQCYVIACNRVGTVGNTTFFGRSCILDPSGEMAVEADKDETLIMGTIDLDNMKRVRSKLPAFADRRPDAYGKL